MSIQSPLETAAEQVVLVDSQDRVLGTTSKMHAHQLGLLHRAFSVFIFDHKDDVLWCLLQKRHPEKYHCGGLWTNACCSHPRLHESIMDAAHRRLQEELGIVNVSLKTVGHFQYHAAFDNGLIEHELDHVLLGYYDALYHIDPAPTEVCDLKWVQLNDLLVDLREQPLKYTPWLSKAFDLVLEDLCYTS